MAGWQVTEQAIAAMNNMSAQLQELAATIQQESEKMKAAFEDNQDGLGAHSADISALIQSVELTQQIGSRPLAKLQLKLSRAALIRQKHLEENRYDNHIGSANNEDRTGIGAAVAAAAVAAGIGAVSGVIAGQVAKAVSNRTAGNTSAGAIASHTEQDIASIGTWIKQINPHYGNPFFPNSSYNCGSCALAVAKRLNGDAAAAASLDPGDLKTDAGMERATGRTCTYMPLADIESHIRAQGDGSHFIIGINRSGNLAGHWFNAYYDGEKICTIDGQSGQVLDWPHDYGHVAEWCIML